MKKLKKTTAVLICILLAVMMLASCSLEENVAGATPTPGADNAAANFTENELTTPVITIGEHVVTLAEYIDFFNEVCTYYSDYYGYDVKSDAETLASYKEMMTSALAKDQMVLHQADILGLSTLTEEQEAEIEENYNKEVADLYDYYTEYAESEAKEDDTIDIDARVQEYILDEAVYYLGEGATIDEYMEYLREQEHEDYIFDLVKQHFISEITVSEEDVKEWYDESAAEDKKYYTDTPEDYKTEREEYDRTGTISDGTTSVPPLYVPVGYSRILVIHVTTDGEVSEDYTKNEASMKTLMSEYGELAFKDAISGDDDNAERMGEIIEEYKALELLNEKELDEMYEESKVIIDKAYDELEEGADFVDVMMEYTDDDEVLKVNENVRKVGLLISTKYASENDWSNDIKDAFSGLKKGEYSEPVRDADGYYIIYNMGNEASGEVELEDIKTEIHDFLLPTLQDEKYDELMEDLMKDEEGIIVYNNDLISKVS